MRHPRPKLVKHLPGPGGQFHCRGSLAHCFCTRLCAAFHVPGLPATAASACAKTPRRFLKFTQLPWPGAASCQTFYSHNIENVKLIKSVLLRLPTFITIALLASSVHATVHRSFASGYSHFETLHEPLAATQLCSLQCRLGPRSVEYVKQLLSRVIVASFSRARAAHSDNGCPTLRCFAIRLALLFLKHLRASAAPNRSLPAFALSVGAASHRCKRTINVR